MLLTFAMQASLPKAAGRYAREGQTWDECGDDSSDGWAIHTWDAAPLGSSEQPAQAVPDAQAASVSGVEPPPGFANLPLHLHPHDLSSPGPVENPEQQPLPAMVSPPPGHVVVLAPQQQQQAVAAAPPLSQQQQAGAGAPPQQQAVAAAPPQQQQHQAAAAAPQPQQQQAVAGVPLPHQQQQALAAAPPLPQQQQQQAMAAAPPQPQQQAAAAAPAPPQHAAQGQPAQQGQVVELDGDFFYRNRPRMLRLGQLRQSSTSNFKDWGEADPQQEAKLARQQQREEAETARFLGLNWNHDAYKNMWHRLGDGAPPAPQPHRF